MARRRRQDQRTGDGPLPDRLWTVPLDPHGYREYMADFERFAGMDYMEIATQMGVNPAAWFRKRLELYTPPAWTDVPSAPAPRIHPADTEPEPAPLETGVEPSDQRATEAAITTGWGRVIQK